MSGRVALGCYGPSGTELGNRFAGRHGRHLIATTAGDAEVTTVRVQVSWTGGQVLFAVVIKTAGEHPWHGTAGALKNQMVVIVTNLEGRA